MATVSFQVLKPKTLVSSLTPQFPSHPGCGPPANLLGSSFELHLKFSLTSHSPTPPPCFKTPSFPTGSPAFPLTCLQSILNMAARGISYGSHIISLLCSKAVIVSSSPSKRNSKSLKWFTRLCGIWPTPYPKFSDVNSFTFPRRSLRSIHIGLRDALRSYQSHSHLRDVARTIPSTLASFLARYTYYFLTSFRSLFKDQFLREGSSDLLI